jgi:hypothetical protein
LQALLTALLCVLLVLAGHGNMPGQPQGDVDDSDYGDDAVDWNEDEATARDAENSAGCGFRRNTDDYAAGAVDWRESDADRYDHANDNGYEGGNCRLSEDSTGAA